MDLLVDDPSDITILVVDDEPINRQVLRNQLEMVGYRVEVAIDGLQGLKLWKVEPTGDFIGYDDAPSLWISNLLSDSPKIQR